jgi:hypothetical protein
VLYSAPNRPLVSPREPHSFVDGTRTIADIFRAVAAEADLAGDWYYGQVAFETRRLHRFSRDSGDRHDEGEPATGEESATSKKGH